MASVKENRARHLLRNDLCGNVCDDTAELPLASLMLSVWSCLILSLIYHIALRRSSISLSRSVIPSSVFSPARQRYLMAAPMS